MSLPKLSPRRYAIVTGAASGLGRAIAVRLARDGWHVALADLDESAAHDTLAEVRTQGGDGQIERLDVRQTDDWHALIARLQSQWPRLDLLVNNAGVVAAGEIDRVPLEEWQRVLDTNLWGTIHGCRAACHWLRQNPGQAQVLNVASITGLVHWPAMGPYGVSKAGVVALSETLCGEWSQYDIGVTLLCPGFFPTSLLERGTFTSPEVERAARGLTDRAAISAVEVAEAAVRALAARQTIVVLPARARRFWRLRRWFPALFLQHLRRRFRRGIVE